MCSNTQIKFLKKQQFFAKDDPCFGNNYILYGSIKTLNSYVTNNQPLIRNYTPLKLYDYSRCYLADALINQFRIPYIEIRAQKDDQLYKHINHCNKVRLFFLNGTNTKLFTVNTVEFFHKCRSKKIPGIRFFLQKAAKDKFNPHLRYFISEAIYDLIVIKLSKS